MVAFALDKALVQLRMQRKFAVCGQLRCGECGDDQGDKSRQPFGELLPRPSTSSCTRVHWAPFLEQLGGVVAHVPGAVCNPVKPILRKSASEISNLARGAHKKQSTPEGALAYANMADSSADSLLLEPCNVASNGGSLDRLSDRTAAVVGRNGVKILRGKRSRIAAFAQ